MCVCVYISECVTELKCVLEGQELEDQSVTSLLSAVRRPYESTLCVRVLFKCVCDMGRWEGGEGGDVLGDT